MTKDLQNARNQVLVDNTAQAVFKHLDRIEDNRAVLGIRWIWELLQNARDAASPDGVCIQVDLSASDLRFQHDGNPFTSKEIAHLVYHGSTKTEDLEEIGQFGSGFLATHLLSRRVQVSGSIEDSNGFDFLLDRSGVTPEELSRAMDRSWAAFEQSVDSAKLGFGTTTSFKYEIAQSRAMKLAEEGLKELRESGSFALAFCPEIKEIVVTTIGAKWKLSRGSQGAEDVLTILYETEEGELSRSVAVAGTEGECCAALQLFPGKSGLEIDPSQQSSAKLFVLFPLIGSERLGLPTTVNSKRFKPREDRDGIVLTGDSDGAQENRRLLEDSIRHQKRLLEWCAQERWPGAERMLTFDISNLPDWAGDDSWFRSLLRELVRKARETKLMSTVAGHWIEPMAAWLPTTENSSHQDRLWTLMSAWEGAGKRLPRRGDLASWSRNLSHWRKLLNHSPEEMQEALTLAKVAKRVAYTESMKELQRQLVNGESLPWLVSLLELVRDADEIGLLDEHGLLPTQAGTLCTRSRLRRDEGICKELKDIGDAFGLEVRETLLHKDAELDGLADLLVPARETELLDRLIAYVKDACREGAIEEKLVSWAVKLFCWISDRPDHVERLEGFPAPTVDALENGVAVTYLERGRKAPERPLAPMATWPQGGEQFGSLFPKRMVLAERFAEEDPHLWPRLTKRGYVNASPLIETSRVVEAFLPDEPLPDREGKGSHRSTQEVEVSDIAFLVKSDTGLIDTARKSRRRATEFIRFLVEHVAEADERAFERCRVECECDERHQIYRAAWLTPLRRRKWVPLDPSGRRSEIASAESLAGLLEDSPETSSLLLGDRGEQLLGALGISRADLALRVVADEEGQRLSLIQSMQDLTEAAGDVNRVRELAMEIREHPGIIETIEERKIRRQKIRRNQEIGSLVEDLLQEELEGCGLTVRRTRIGSDFEVESDFVENNDEMGLELSGRHGTTLIEVKSTKVDQVRMTPVQAEHACSLKEKFALCVVPIDEDAPTSATIRERLRVVFGVGTYLEASLGDYELVREAEVAARRPHGAVELEIIEGQARFRVGRAVWEDGLSLGQAIGRFKGLG